MAPDASLSERRLHLFPLSTAGDDSLRRFFYTYKYLLGRSPAEWSSASSASPFSDQLGVRHARCVPFVRFDKEVHVFVQTGVTWRRGARSLAFYLFLFVCFFLSFFFVFSSVFELLEVIGTR